MTIAETAVSTRLTGRDMCDRDVSEQALVRLVNGQGEFIDFCAHHYRDHSDALMLKGWLIADDRRRDLNVPN